MRTFLGIFLSLQFLLHASEWKTDYQAALALSKEKNQPLLLAFVGSQWCPWSQKLQNEVFSQAPFLENMEDFILVKIDLSEFNKPNDPAFNMKEKFCIEEIPSFVLVSSKEEEMARIGYTPLPAAEFADLMKQIKKSYEEISQTDFTSLEGERLQELYFAALKFGFNDFRYRILAAGLQIDKTPFFLLEKYKLLVEAGKINKKEALDVRKELIKRDPKNVYGIHRTLAIVDFHRLSNRYRLRKKPDDVVKPLLDYVRVFGADDKEHLWKVQMMIAQFYFSRDLIEKALQYAQDSYKVAPDEAQEEIIQSIDFLKSKL